MISTVEPASTLEPMCIFPVAMMKFGKVTSLCHEDWVVPSIFATGAGGGGKTNGVSDGVVAL